MFVPKHDDHTTATVRRTWIIQRRPRSRASKSDLVAIATVVATQARGLSHSRETVNNRLLFVDKLKL
jgi:hypothetical protein